MFLLGALFVLFSSTLGFAATHCVDLRAVEQVPSPSYQVNCTGGPVQISAGEYHSNKGENGDFGQFCPQGPEHPTASEYLRYQTPSGRPEVCDVTTRVPGQIVRNAQVVYFLHQDFYEEEIFVSEHALVWQGNDLINFNPPVPGITVGP